jgi:hypothetical protein
MKKIILSLILVSAALSFTFAQKSNPVKSVDVTARSIASQPADKPLVIDLTHNGTVYNLAAGIDYSRVQVRAATGEIAVDRLTGRFRTDAPVLLGNAADLRAGHFGFSPNDGLRVSNPGVSNATCEFGLCGCTGYHDCNDLDRSGTCAVGTWSCGVWKVGPSTGKRGCVCLVKLSQS